MRELAVKTQAEGVIKEEGTSKETEKEAQCAGAGVRIQE